MFIDGQHITYTFISNSLSYGIIFLLSYGYMHRNVPKLIDISRKKTDKNVSYYKQRKH